MANAEKILELGKKRKLKKVLKYVGNKKEEIRAAAFEALGQIPGDDSVNALVTGLGDPSANVRLKIALSLQKIGSDRTTEFLKHQIAKETDATVKKELQKALNADRDKEA
jgi:HEAT repeat protein